MSHQTILYITPALSIGGAEKFLISLANSLVPEKENQILVSLEAVNSLHHELDQKIGFVTLPRKFKFDLNPVIKLRRLIKSKQPEVIFCINFYSYIIARCAMLGLNINTKRIISYHSTIHVTRKEHLLHKLYACLLTKKDTIVTVSTNQAIYTAENYNISKNKFTTIHNGVDINYWHPPVETGVREHIRKKYGIPLDSQVIVMSAALRIEKNHLGAINALHLLHTLYQQKAFLLLVGDGVMREAIKELSAELNVQDYVKFAGMQKEVRPFYWASDLFTLCSTSVETFSIAALEAMACGLPCVLTNIGGASEMIQENLNGFVCKIHEDDIARTWSKALRTSFSKNAIHGYTRDNFSSEKMLKEYKKIL
jgi:glycosyltransferase involved in cell wall biosynthesis